MFTNIDFVVIFEGKFNMGECSEKVNAGDLMVRCSLAESYIQTFAAFLNVRL